MTQTAVHLGILVELIHAINSTPMPNNHRLNGKIPYGEPNGGDTWFCLFIDEDGDWDFLGRDCALMNLPQDFYSIWDDQLTEFRNEHNPTLEEVRGACERLEIDVIDERD